MFKALVLCSADCTIVVPVFNGHGLEAGRKGFRVRERNLTWLQIQGKIVTAGDLCKSRYALLQAL